MKREKKIKTTKKLKSYATIGGKTYLRGLESFKTKPEIQKYAKCILKNNKNT